VSVPPLRRQVLVVADPATAYRVFVHDIGARWPIASHGCFGAEATIAFDGERFVETAPDGRTAVWGTVTESREPSRVAFTWHPGRDAGAATHVEVTFAPAGEGTLVTLVHTGWEAYADPEAARSDYGRGWPKVLGRFAAVVSGVWRRRRDRPRRRERTGPTTAGEPRPTRDPMRPSGRR
jgi:hypothetical protein